MTSSSIFEIFELKNEKSNPEQNPKWVRARLSEKWSQKEMKYFKQLLDHHQRAKNAVKERENILEEYEKLLTDFKVEYEDYEEGEIVDENIDQKLIEDLKSEIEICKEKKSRIEKHIIFLESYMYCLMTEKDK